MQLSVLVPVYCECMWYSYWSDKWKHGHALYRSIMQNILQYRMVSTTDFLVLTLAVILLEVKHVDKFGALCISIW